MSEPGLVGTIMVASWAFRLRINEVVAAVTEAECADGTMRGLRVGDVTGVGDAIYDEFCDKKWAAGEERRMNKVE
jgi:hypothetical protein